jgi:hypothetical protein
MSSNAISGVGGIASAPLNPTFLAIQSAAKAQPATTPAPAPPASNGVQPILLVPTKPPLSSAVLAELIGQQISPYGSSVGQYSGYERPADSATATGTDHGVSSLG